MTPRAVARRVLLRISDSWTSKLVKTGQIWPAHPGDPTDSCHQVEPPQGPDAATIGQLLADRGEGM